MKYDMSCKVFAIVFSKLLKDYYAMHNPQFDVKKVIKDVKREYKAMILRTPGLPKGNIMLGNLKGAAYFFAMAKVVPNLTPDELNNIIDIEFDSKLMHKMYDPKKAKGTLFSQKERDKMEAQSKRSQTSKEIMDWQFDYEGSENEIKYNMTRCGVCKLAEQENLKEFLPCMCRMDYAKYKLQGATLKREKTLANGDDVCDFDLIRDK